MSELEKLINPPKTTGVRWDLPESTMVVIKGYQKQLWKATGKYPKLEQVVAHMIEYVGREACDKYFNEIEERKQREKEAIERQKGAEEIHATLEKVSKLAKSQKAKA
jgi:hypothetical protein